MNLPEDLITGKKNWNTAKMAGTPKEPGPSSERVAANLRRIRHEREYSYAELSRRLAAAGHPILDTGLMKIEKGQRRVDVDDLTAIAAALGVTPNALLLPPLDPAAPGRAYQLTPGMKGTAPELWSWATGEVPLGRGPVTVNDSEQDRYAEANFAYANLPHHYTRELLADLMRLGQATDDDAVPASDRLGTGLARALLSGLTTAQVRYVTEAAILASLTMPEEKLREVLVPGSLPAADAKGDS